MLSYRHAYHAGNLGDILKHPVLCMLLRALQNKNKPFCYIDTHAGAGIYDLTSRQAQKNKEFLHGVIRIWKAKRVPGMLQDYLECLRALNPEAASLLHRYPGSPAIAQCLLRPTDRIVLRERNRNDCAALEAALGQDRRVSIECGDGYQGLRAHLPPRERRGLVLIDPSYEDPDEFDRVFDGLSFGIRRWPGGIFVLWYPLLARYPVARFLERLKTSGIPKIFLVELGRYPLDNPLGLNGSGLVIVNPPYGFDKQVAELLPWLWQQVAVDGLGGYRNEWLVPESTVSPNKPDASHI